MAKKPIHKWTGDDFRAEAARVLQDKDGSSDVTIAAMILMMLRDPASLSGLASELGTDADSLAAPFLRLKSNGFIVGQEMMHKDQLVGEHGGLQLCLMVNVARGFMESVGGDKFKTTEAGCAHVEGMGIKPPHPEDA